MPEASFKNLDNSIVESAGAPVMLVRQVDLPGQRCQRARHLLAPEESVVSPLQSQSHWSDAESACVYWFGSP
jgi:hypothetical protein